MVVVVAASRPGGGGPGEQEAKRPAQRSAAGGVRGTNGGITKEARRLGRRGMDAADDLPQKLKLI